MDWKTLIAEIVASVTWPTAVALIAWWFRSDIRKLVQRLTRLRHNETEVEFAHQTSVPETELAVEASDRKQQRSAMEYKILRTLWTKQVNRWPDMSHLWTFRMNANYDRFLEYREASNRLIGEGLVRETNHGQLYLTKEGFAYCKEHYHDFPSDQWWPEETIDEKKLGEVPERR